MTERKRVYSGSPYEGAFGFCRAIKCGDLVAVAGTAPIPPPGQEVAETAYEQMQRCIEIVSSALAELDADLSDLTRTRMYLSSAACRGVCGCAPGSNHGRRLPPGPALESGDRGRRPTRKTLDCGYLISPAIIGSSRHRRTGTEITTSPKEIPRA